MSERALTFGPRGELVGVLGMPDAPHPSTTRPAVLTWNVGVNHRVGPYRFFVDLARRLAEAGFSSLRFDASGLGDSDVRREAVADSERARLDLEDAIQLAMRRTGATSVVVIGYCSSVDAAHALSVRDARVAGAIHVEGYCYRNTGFKLHAMRELFSRERWERYVARRYPALLGPVSMPPPSGEPESVYKRDLPTWAAFTHDLEQLTAQKKPLLFVYGGDTDYNHDGQFWEMFGSPRIDRRYIDIEFARDADHTFYDPTLRRGVIAHIVSWLSARFP